MYTHVALTIIVATLMSINALSDGEIDKIKKLVDKELVTREVELLKKKEKNSAIPDDANEIVHPLGPKGGKKPKTEPAPTKKPVSEPKKKPTRKPVILQTTEHPDTGLQESIDNCIDIYDSSKCKALIYDEGMDCNKDEMQLLCEKSCKFCGNHMNPVDCRLSIYGCCTDMFTPKTDPWGSTCPVCKDNVEELCVPHISDCNEIGMVGNWMRTNCKLTCEICKPGDHGPKPKLKADCKDKNVFCGSWARNHLCDLLPDMMNTNCQKSCRRCHI